MTAKHNSNIRDQNLTQALVELVAVHQGNGIHHNKIINKLAEEGFSSKSAIGNKLKELQSIGVIEYQIGDDGKHLFYIHGATKPEIKYDKQFASLLSNLHKILDEIEENIIEMNQNTRNYYYENLTNAINSLKSLPSFLTESSNVPPEDDLIDEISSFSIYENDIIHRKIQDARNIQKTIRKLKEKKLNAIQKILKTNNDAKKGPLCAVIIESSKEIEKSLNSMWELRNDLNNLKSTHQDTVFKQIFDSCTDKSIKYTTNYSILKELQAITNTTTDVNVRPKLNNVITHFYQKTQKPIKKNLLIKKLVETKQFSKDEAQSMLRHMGISNLIFVHDNDVFPVHVGYPLSNSNL